VKYNSAVIAREFTTAEAIPSARFFIEFILVEGRDCFIYICNDRIINALKIFVAVHFYTTWVGRVSFWMVLLPVQDG
jgi:elongation factor P hydroxylase